MNSLSPTRCAGPISRRSFMEIGSVGLGGLGLADLLRLRAEASAAGSAAPDTSVILVWIAGGLPHMEMYDMKPEAPAEFRGEFRPVPTNVPGIDVCELMPLHTKIADRFSLIRSITHEFSDHGGGHKRMMTGRIPKTPSGFVNDAPAAPSIIAKIREKSGASMPNNVLLADHYRTGVDVYSLGSAYLGPSYNPFDVPGDPSAADFQVRNLSLTSDVATRLGDRRALLGGLDNLRRNVDRSGSIDAMDKYNQQAYQMLTSEKARAAFDLSQEDAITRERYGHHAWGQRALLGRRLVEAGSSFVTVVMENPEPSNANRSLNLNYNWDCHASTVNVFIDTRWRLPYLDQAVTALIEDLYQRGLDKKVLIVLMGEFGHTPRINYAVNAAGVMGPGRDHWPQAQSVLVSGGGLRMGQVVGSTNAKGEAPKDRPLTPNDLWATIYRHLGIDYNHAFLDHSGRPMPILPFGEPIRELI